MLDVCNRLSNNLLNGVLHVTRCEIIERVKQAVVETVSFSCIVSMLIVGVLFITSVTKPKIEIASDKKYVNMPLK